MFYLLSKRCMWIIRTRYLLSTSESWRVKLWVFGQVAELDWYFIGHLNSVCDIILQLPFKGACKVMLFLKHSSVVMPFVSNIFFSSFIQHTSNPWSRNPMNHWMLTSRKSMFTTTPRTARYSPIFMQNWWNIMRENPALTWKQS